MEPTTPEQIPNEPIAAFHITARDHKKAVRVRALLAANAPLDAGSVIKNVPIQHAPRIRKNRMYAITSRGMPLLEINLKNGEISFVEPGAMA